METILNTLIEYLTNESTFLGYFLLLVALLFANWSNIIAFIEDRKNAKIKVLTDALECEHIKGLMRENLKSELIKQYFRLATGINAEKNMREAILHTIDGASGELKISHFEDALLHLTVKNGELSVDLSRFFKYVCWFLWLVGFFFFIVGLLIISGSFSLIKEMGWEGLYYTLAGVMLCSGGLVFKKCSRLGSSAGIIQRYLKNNVNSAT